MEEDNIIIQKDIINLQIDNNIIQKDNINS